MERLDGISKISGVINMGWGGATQDEKYSFESEFGGVQDLTFLLFCYTSSFFVIIVNKGSTLSAENLNKKSTAHLQVCNRLYHVICSNLSYYYKFYVLK